MANLVSPGVQVKEIDLTNVVPSVSSTIGAMAGAFAWGPANEVSTVHRKHNWLRSLESQMRTHLKVFYLQPNF